MLRRAHDHWVVYRFRFSHHVCLPLLSPSEREYEVRAIDRRPLSSKLDGFFLLLALPALDDDVVRPYYSNSVLWTSEMDYNYYSLRTMKSSW